jgi:hypothetical protein
MGISLLEIQDLTQCRPADQAGALAGWGVGNLYGAGEPHEYRPSKNGKLFRLR